MAKEMPAGLTFERTTTVTPDMSPPHLSDVQVLSTPSMINLMEQACLQAMVPFLEGDETSVGTEVCVTHDSGLNVGQEATVKATLRSVEGRRYVWDVEATGPDGKKLGGGTHKRAVVSMARLRGR